jgi:RNA polymerase sigma-54 factor
MAIEIKQSLRLSQQLVMTPQLQQAIKLLQLNRLELVDHIQTEMLENPVLEENAEAPEPEEAAAADKVDKTTENEEVKELEGKGEGTEDFNWDNYLQSYTAPPQGAPKLNDDDLPPFEASMTKHTTLTEHLLWQLNLARFADEEMNVAMRVIGNIDENGYFRGVCDEIAAKEEVTKEFVELILSRIQEFDPMGVGARDLQECLMIQTKKLINPELPRKIIGSHMKELERRNFPAIAKALKLPVEKIAEAADKIAEMDPKPGRPFYDESGQYITPDIYIYRVGDEFVIALNEDGLPKLRISGFYQNLMRGAAASKLTKEYVNDKMRSALWLIRSIHQRQRTINKVTDSVIRCQKEFLLKGINYLKPMVLKDVAEDIGMHESTVSRVTSGKYIHTPQGIYELKFFFNSGIKRVEGSAAVASESVKEKIRNLIAAENAKKPFSDQEIVEQLRQTNIDIARRTVAKYREMLGILSSSKRKKLY